LKEPARGWDHKGTEQKEQEGKKTNKGRSREKGEGDGRTKGKETSRKPVNLITLAFLFNQEGT